MKYLWFLVDTSPYVGEWKQSSDDTKIDCTIALSATSSDKVNCVLDCTGSNCGTQTYTLNGDAISWDGGSATGILVNLANTIVWSTGTTWNKQGKLYEST